MISELFDEVLGQILWPLTRDRPRLGVAGLAQYLHGDSQDVTEAALRPDFPANRGKTMPPFWWLQGGDLAALREAAQRRPQGRQVHSLSWHLTDLEAVQIQGALATIAVAATFVRSWLKDRKTTAAKLDDVNWKELVRFGAWRANHRGEPLGVAEVDLGRAVELIAYEDKFGRIVNPPEAVITRGLRAIARSPWRRVPVEMILDDEPLTVMPVDQLGR